MTRRILPAAAVLALVVAGGAFAANERGGYLAPGAFDVKQVLPPAPVKGDVRYDADRRIFRQTRAMIGSPRYALATNDAQFGWEHMLTDFSCSVGVALDAKNAPQTLNLIQRAGIDTGDQTKAAKDFYKRLRPYKIDKGEICQDKRELADSYDYPSGHTTWGWTWALVLADLLPERATPILARGRAYGDSRFICGAHNFSAVEAGRLSASSTMAAVRTTPGYKHDFAAAQAELRTLLADPNAPRPQGCEQEAALVAQRVP